MKYIMILKTSVLILMISSCSALRSTYGKEASIYDREVNYQTNTVDGSDILILPSHDLHNVLVTIDDKLVWDKSKGKRLNSLTIHNIPAGNHTVKVVSVGKSLGSKVNYSNQVNLKGNGATHTEFISTPNTDEIITGLIVLGVLLLYMVYAIGSLNKQ